jgi:hypothetical protein
MVRQSQLTFVHQLCQQKFKQVPVETIDSFLAYPWTRVGLGMAFAGADKLYQTLKEEYVGISQSKVRDL